jgi:nucleoside-diphosphate-sugar epimerase
MEKITNQKILITGASGFLGGRLLKHFTQAYPDAEFLGMGRRSDRQAEFKSLGCAFQTGDLLNTDDCQSLTAGQDAIIHAAAMSSPWGRYEDYYAANVQATRNLLDAAQANGVKRFVLISTPSVYQNYKDRLNVRESDPLPKKTANFYAATKLEAERITLTRNGQDIETIAIRPRAIIGAEDAVIFPRVLRAYAEGKLRIIGSGKNRVDLTCAQNVIEAVRCCLLAPENALGRPYNISNDEPIELWTAINYMLEQLHLKPVTARLPTPLAMTIAGLVELWARWFGKGKEPAMTRMGISYLANSLTMDISQAKEKLGYAPVQTTNEGIQEFVAWYQQQPK